MLRFIWVKEYKNIKAQGFLFDPTPDIDYDPETGHLMIKSEEQSSKSENQPSQRLPTGFFGRNISLVTGVLGENGAGKSTLMEFIRSVAGSFTNGSSYDTPPCLFVFGNTIIHESAVLLSNSAMLVSQGYSVHPYEDHISYNQFSANTGGVWKVDPITEHAYVYYSNFWESSWLYPAPGVVDVSTTHLFENLHTRGYNLIEEKQDSLAAYWTQSFISEIRLLHYLRISGSEGMPFPIPRSLNLRAKEPKEIYQVREVNDEFFEANQVENLKGWPREYERLIQSATETSAIEEFIHRFILPRLLGLMRIFPQDFARLSPEELGGLASLQTPPPRVKEAELARQLKVLYEFITVLRAASEAKQIILLPMREQYGGVVTRDIQLNTDAMPQEKFERLFSQLSQMPGGEQTFEARWFGLSSGQSAYLRLYSRLYQALKRVESRPDTHHQNIRTVTILVDEGETGFHPEWQKNYMQLLFKAVEQLFAAYQVQLIVGSNSPFIASDLPKDNLLLLHRREADKLCEVQPWGGEEQTFAANIHTLLTDAFFMSGGLMGEFAKAKVTGLIQYLQEEAIPGDDRREQMRATLELIGEPVIRMKMREMWNIKFGLQERLADLQQQMRDVEEQIRRNG